jgi:hypothetical protein
VAAHEAPMSGKKTRRVDLYRTVMRRGESAVLRPRLAGTRKPRSGWADRAESAVDAGDVAAPDGVRPRLPAGRRSRGHRKARTASSLAASTKRRSGPDRRATLGK